MSISIAEDIVVDSEFCGFIPPLGREELTLLEQNILQDGCRDPLVVWGNILIDGHNRLEICRKYDIEFQVRDIEFASRDAVKLWMIDNQLGKRNIADIDRIALARRKEELLRPLAKENQKEHGGTAPGRTKNTSGKIAESVPIDTRKQSAKTAGVGERTYDAGKLILDAAESGEISPDELESVRRGKKSINRLARDIKESRSRKRREDQRSSAVARAEEGAMPINSLYVGDFRSHYDKIADGSLSLIFTDPPYDRKACELFEPLSEFAEAKLCEGGSLIAYIGHIQVGPAFSALSSRLRYWWTICCLHSGGEALMTEYGIRVGWKPVLWFVKGTRDNKSNIVRDVMSGGREKSHHDWQQSQEEAEYWINELCPADGIVCDPFIGGGTTAAAAISCGRQWIGFEKDPRQAAIAAARLEGLCAK